MLAVHDNFAECETTAAPVPVKEMIVGELEVLLVIVVLPVTLPVAAGVKVTFRVAV